VSEKQILYLIFSNPVPINSHQQYAAVMPA